MEPGHFSIVLLLLIFLVAFLYSSVGHGGASGYLAVMSFFPFAAVPITTTALILNILVSGTAFASYRQAQHFKWKLLWPFLLTSVPMSFLGGLIQISEKQYAYLLALVLLFAAIRMNVTFSEKAEDQPQEFSFLLSLLIGGIIGLISGIVGIGGGIFLSPLLILMNWATAKESAAVSALFILINSAAGLTAKYLSHQTMGVILLPLTLSAFAGGLCGSYLGANRFTNFFLRRILGIVLLIATIKLCL